MSEYRAALKKKKKDEEVSSPSKSVAVSSKTDTSSSFMDDYRKEKSRLLAVQEEEDDIAPVLTEGTSLKDEEEERSWFRKGLFEDGYQFGDVSKTILGSTTDVLENLGTGVIGMGEKAVDALAFIAPFAADAQFYQNGGFNLETEKAHKQAVEQSKKDIGKFIAKDLYDEEAVAKAIISNPVRKVTGVDSEAVSVFGEKSDSLVQSAGQLAATVGLQAAGVPWWVSYGVTSFGEEAENALNQDATYEEAALSATISAAAEVLTEKLSGGIKFGGKAVDDVLTKQIARSISNKYLRTGLKLGLDMVGEGAEEWITADIQKFGQWLTYQDEQELKELLFSEEAMDEKIEAFIGGVALGGGISTVNAVKTSRKGIDYATEMTENEKKVVDKVYQDRVAELEQNGKVTEKQKSKVYDEVLNDFEKGYISTETIEEVLGGENYQRYKQTVDSENALFDQQKALQEEFDTLNKMKQGEMTGEQIDRRADLKVELAKIKETIKSTQNHSARSLLKQRLSDSVSEMVRSDRLIESYNEQSRRGQAFEADLTQYDEKQQQTIQNAIKSGTLNNTRRTHELVDFISKVSADKGVPFDFTNNEKIKGTRFAVEGKTVNGYVTESGITLNVQSPKYLESTVGHEITHVLEGTDFYNELQETIFKYAESKGEYQSRLDALTKLYEGQDADIKAELTADLVGDYIFSDTDFVNRLSTENRNVFQKIYDEIKYLCKVATAGSKEARQLEKVKKVFEDAYRANGKAVEGTKNSLGYHAGDLGKAEGYHMQGRGRGTGHFGTGTYFVGDEAKISDDYTYGKRPHHTVELDTYNLYKIRSDKDGYELHDQLRVIDGGLSQEFLDAARADKFNVSELRRKAWKLADSYDTQVWDEELGMSMSQDYIATSIRAYTEVANDNGLEVKTYDEWLKDESGEVISPDESDYNYYRSDYLQYLKQTLETVDKEKNSGYEDFRDAYFKLWLRFGKNNVNRALQAVVEHDTAMQNGGYDAQYGADSLATVFMKALGYEGVNASGTGLDNTKYGSVIYDLKGEDLARKKEIGTAKYSLSDSDGKLLTKEQQEYFKDSKMRDENGNLKVMYHGSQDAGFHVFDAKMSDDDTSFFFVDRNDVAASYSGTTETYEAKTIRTAEDMNNFIAEIDAEGYEVIEKDGKFTLLYEGDRVADSDTAQGIYKEFCWYEGVGEGDANYKVYLNLKNPLEVDAKGRNWDNVSREFSQEIADRYHSLTAEEKAALHDIAEWGEISIFRDEIRNAKEGALASAYEKLGKDINMYDLFSIAEDNFSDLSIEAWAVKQMNTRDYAQKAKAEGYDGVIFKNIVDNGGYSNGSEGASTVAIAFDSNQIKSVANANPTADPDIRYSLGEVTDAQNEQGLSRENEVQYSLSRDTQFSDNAIAKNNTSLLVDPKAMAEAKALRGKIAARMNDIKDRGLVGLPEDQIGNTYIANSSYDGTEENTTICPRSLASEAFVDAVSEYLGRPLTVNEQIYISQDLQGRSLTPECTYCYVATDRKAYRAFLGEYIKQRDTVLQKVQDNPNADLSRSGELYKEFLNGRKDTKPMYSRFKMWVDAYKNGRPLVDASHLANINKLMGDISEFGDELKPQIVDAMKYAQSASWAKKRVNYVAYNGHILGWKQDRINKLNSHYGLRMYSFSDFHPAFVLENMQMITDASVRGLKMLGYTKDTDFVDIFAPSGMNINVSTFGFESGGNVYENNIIGAEWEKAKALREQYPNVGITFVATNDTLVDWALDQDWIDVVIPYHLVRTGAEVAKAFGYNNYTSESADTKAKDWTKGKDKKYIAPTEHNNDKATYLAALEKNHLKPRFERFIDNPNYMKLVNECRQSASQSKPVQPVFNEDAAMVALAKLEANGYYQPIGGSVDRMYEIAAEVAENMTDTLPTVEMTDGWVRDIPMKQELAPAMSLSNEGDAPYGNRGTLGKDVAYVDTNATNADSNANSVLDNATVSETESVADMFPDNIAPVQDELERLEAERNEIYGGLEAALEHGSDSEVGQLAAEYDSITARIRELEADENQRTDSLTDADIPPEMEAPYTETTNAPVENPFEDREWNEVVGKAGRKAKAYMYEHPEMKPFFQAEAQNLLGEWSDTQRGERIYNDQLYYDSGGEKGWMGIKRMTSQSMETLLDEWGMSYDEIEKGLKAIIEDHGAENISAAKKIEFMLNDRLLNGYKNFYDRGYVQPNQDYINLLEEMQINSYSKEAFDAFMATADQYAPAEDIAPVKPLAKATPDTMTAPLYESKDKTAVKGQTSLFEPPKPNPKVATVLTEESAIEKEKSGIGMKLASALVDKGMVFENLSLKKGNRELQAKWNYALPSNTEARAQYFMENGANGVKSLKDIQKKVDKSGKADDFFNYLYHVHNIDRMTLDERFGVENKTVFGETVTADVSRRKVAQFEKSNPEFKNWANDVYAYNRHLRNLLVENSVISQETADLWEKMYPHYVPIRRVDAKGQNISVPLDTNKTGVNNPIKKATGGSSDIQPVFSTMAQRTEQTYRAIARNAFGIELKNTLGSTLNSQKNTTGVDETIDTLVQQEDHLLKPGAFGNNPTFTVFENGERVEFEITEDMFDALKPAGKLLGYRNKAINAVGNARRNLLTTLNPVFALYRNPIKDMQDVAINSQHAARTYLNVPNAIAQMAIGGKYATEYHENGGKSNTYFDSRTNQFKAEDNIFKKTIGLPVRAIETAGEFIEEIPRLAEYIASRQSGRSVERSMLDAARVTTNFAAGGDFTKFLNSHGFTFLNASVQGVSQHVRNFREAKQQGLKGYVKVLAKYTIAGLPTILLNSMLWDDDEEYEELSDYVKQNYYVVAKTEDGKFVRIPKGRTAAVMGELMNQMQNLVTGDDEADFTTFYELFMNNIAPNNPIENNILAPIMQVKNNEAWYGGDLVPSRLQDLPAAEQFDESTDSISKWLGEKTNTSPYKWNYLLDQYSGGLGDMVLPTLTPEAESGDNSLMGNILAPWKKEITTDMVLNNKNPGDFYDLKDNLEKLSNSKNATEEDSMRSMYMDSVSWEMGDLYAQKREWQNSGFSDAKKYEKVREIQEQINELAKAAMEGYNDVSIDGLYSEVGDRRYNKDAESGKWYEIREKNSDGSDNYYYKKEQEVTQALGISYGEYWNNREEYNYAYDKPEQYALSQAVGGYDSYRGYTSKLWDIKADKDENGKSINGSRKDKVIDYLNELDIDYYHKIILFKNEYNADDTYNEEIIDYLNGREDISYQQMESILKYLGFDVDSEGNISWD